MDWLFGKPVNAVKLTWGLPRLLVDASTTLQRDLSRRIALQRRYAWIEAWYANLPLIVGVMDVSHYARTRYAI